VPLNGITNTGISWLMGSNLFRLTSPTLHFNTLRMIKLIAFLLVSICPKEIPLSSFHDIIKSETHVTFPKAINKVNLRGKATNVRLCLENDLNVFIYASVSQTILTCGP
jgi:hypothetical protein